VAVDFGAAASAAPHQIGRHADRRIATPRRAALDAFQQERIGLAGSEAQEHANRRVEIGHALAPDHLPDAGGKPFGEAGVVDHARHLQLDR